MSKLSFDKKKGKFLVFVALMTLLCILVIWWIFSTGSGTNVGENKTKGLNTLLPGAHLKSDSARDKLSFYAAATQDSIRRMEQMRMDPNRQDSINKVQKSATAPMAMEMYAARSFNYSAPGADPIEVKMKAIQRQLLSSTESDYPGIERKPVAVTRQPRPIEPVADPEMEAINATLDKIMAIQHPKAVNAKQLPKGFEVNLQEHDDATYFGESKPSNLQTSFYSDAATGALLTTALIAIIPTEQVLQSGATVKLELGSSITVNNHQIPAGTLVFGYATLDGERLHVAIPSIRQGNNIFPVSLSVYDMDGLEGIYVPGSISREVAKESADNAIQSAGLTGLGVSLKTQAAAAGIGAAKSLLSKKVKQARVTIAAGYKVLLRDNKQTGQ